MLRSVFILLRIFQTFAIVVNLSYSSSACAAGAFSNNSVYCHQGECLYCDEAGCMITPSGADQPMDIDDTSGINDLDESSARLLDERLSKLEAAAPSFKIHHHLPSHQMPVVTQRTVRRNQIKQIPVPVIKSQAGKKIKKPKKQPSQPLAPKKPLRIESAEVMPKIFYYKPTIDFAQYAVHEGDSRSANLIEGIIPLGKFPIRRLWFVDLRYYNPNGGAAEINIDLGFRGLFHQQTRLFGLYTGYDHYRSSTGRHFNQVHVGSELWLNRFFLGVNGYLPLGTKVYDNNAVNLAYLSSTSTTNQFNIIAEQGKERVLPGADAEIGVDMTHGLTVYAGGYYFDHADAHSVLGPKLRATYTFYRSSVSRLFSLFDRIRLEGLVSHDSVRGTTWLAGLRFTFGIGSDHPNPTTGVARHMVDPIRRDLNVIDQSYNVSPTILTQNGSPIVVEQVDNTTDLEDAITNSDIDVVGVLGSMTATDTLTVGDHALAITGGDYEFTVNSNPFTATVGRNGSLTAASSTDLFDISGGTSNITLENFTASVDEDYSFLDNTSSSSSFGIMTIENVTSDAPISLEVGNGQSGQLAFNHNRFITSVGGGIDVNADGTDAQLDVLTFTHNTVTSSDSDDNNTAIFQANNAGALTVGAVQSNVIKLLSDSGGNYVPLAIRALTGGDIKLNEGIRNNTVISTAIGINSDGLRLFVVNASSITLSHGIINNTIRVGSESSQNFACGLGIAGAGTITVNGGIKNNDITVLSEDSEGLGLQAGLNNSLVVNGGVIGNTISVDTGGNGINIASTPGATLNISDGFYSNKVTVEGDAGTAIALSTRDDEDSTVTVMVNRGTGSGASLLIAQNNLSAEGELVDLDEGTTDSIVITP